VLTKLWLYNVEADFDLKATTIETKVKFKKAKWRLPIESITDIDLATKDDRVQLCIKVDKKKQNDILVIFGGKRINKDARKLLFEDLNSARLFLFHLKRLYWQSTRKELPVSDAKIQKS